jgi:ATP-dependent Clp protease ATP-binding subunit ClpC
MNKLLRFPYWWYGDSLRWFKRLFKNLTVFLDNRLAVYLNLRMLFVPLFHDVSWLGRILSFIYRLVKIVIGGATMLLAITAMGFWLICWLLLPLATVVYLKTWGLIIIGAVWLLACIRECQRSPYSLELKLMLKQTNGNCSGLKQLILKDAVAREILERLEITPDAVLNLTDFPDMAGWLKQAEKDVPITPADLLLALLNKNSWRTSEANKVDTWIKQRQSWDKIPFIWEKEYESRPIGGIDRAMTGIPTPELDKYSQDLTKMAQKRQLPEMFGKEEAATAITQILSRRQQNNVLVIGEPGSGKTTLVKSIAQEIVRGVKAPSLKFKRLIALDVSLLAAGAGGAELNRRMTKIISEIRAAGNIILFVDEVHNLASINQTGPETSSVFTALEPVLSEGAFQFIGATSTENYKKFIQPNDAFARIFTVVELKEATAEQTLSILKYIAWQREKTDHILITYLALNRIVELAQELIHDRVLPDKAVNLLDEAAAISVHEGKPRVTTAEINTLVAKKTKVPVTKLTQQEKDLLLHLESRLHQKIIGQDEAVKAISNALRRSRTGLKNKNKPIAGFLFAGPTGVGKTETAKALAEEFFGSAALIIRLDMSEYQTMESVDRMSTLLTDNVRRQPFSLILLDEIEKAHPKIHNLFLQVLDDARLTDPDGKTADFNNTIIIATTNAGLTQEAIEAKFLPEFLNRFTAIIFFTALTKPEIKTIVNLKLKRLQQELAKQELKVNFDNNTVTKLTQSGFSPKWGGRQIDRTIQERVGDVIAKKILEGKILPRQPWTFSL